MRRSCKISKHPSVARAWALILLASLAGCDAKPDPAPTPASPPPSPALPPATPPAPPASPAAQPPANPPAAQPPASPPRDTAPVGDESFAALVERLTAKLPTTADPHATGFARLQTGAFAEAQAFFALAARRDERAWKHPYNLACAAARGGDEAVARIALIEAMRRGGATVQGKASRDADLANVRATPWFEPVLRGEATPPAPAPIAAPPVANPPIAAPAPATEPPIATPPSTEPPVATPPAPIAAPPAPPKVELPRGSTTPIADTALTLLRTSLTAIHHTAPVVRASLQHGEVGWMIYEISRYDACLGEHAGDEKARKKCRHKLVGVPGPGAPTSMECTDQYLIKISPVDPPTLGKPEKLKLACALLKVRRLDALDLDGDGQDEVLVDVVGQHSSEGFRESEERRSARVVRVLRPDGSVQLQFDVAWTAVDIAPDEATVRRFELRDDDGDGHADMIVSGRGVMATPDVALDDELWPAGPAGDELGEISTAVWRYSVKKDRWIKPAK